MKRIRGIVRRLWPYKWRALASVVCNILSAFFSLFSLSLLIPFLGVLFGTMPLVDTRPEFALSLSSVRDTLYYFISQLILSHGRSAALLMVITFVVANSLLKNLFVYLSSWHIAFIRHGVIKDLRNALYSKVVSLPLGFYSEERKGDVMSKMSNDVNEIEVSVVGSLELVFRDPIIILVHLFGLLLISVKLTVFVLILLPISGLIIGRIGKSLRKRSLTGQEWLGGLLALIEETLGGLRIVKAFNAERQSNQRFTAANAHYTRLMVHINRRRALAPPLSEFLGTVVMGVALWYGGTLVLGADTSLSPEALIGFMGLFYMILNPAKSFSTAYFNIQKGLASADRVETILEAINPIQSPLNPLPKPTFRHGIEYRDVHFSYADREILHGVNLSIQKGMTVALVGQSGSGKTTLADLLPRFYDVQGGQILLDGHDIREYNVTDLRALMGNVNQEPILFNDTFYNNISFGTPNASRVEVEQAARIANAHDFIMETEQGYDTNIGDRGSKLSGGQRQRISIARAILKNPPIMILDEATSSLDTTSERLVQDALESLMKNRTSLVIAHRLSTVKDADLICVVRDGYIVETGRHEELLAKGGEYSTLYNMQLI